MALPRRSIVVAFTGLVAAISGGCSYFTADEAAYRNSRSLDYLKPPQGVEIPRPNHTYRVPEVPDSASDSATTPKEQARLVTPGQETPPAPAAEEPRHGHHETGTVQGTKPPVAEKPVARDPAKTVSRAAVREAQAEAAAPVPTFVTRQKLTDEMAVKERPDGATSRRTKASERGVTTRNWFVVDARPEKVWARLVSYWMDRGFPLIESSPINGKIVTDWVPAVDKVARAKGIRDQFEVLLERDKAGSKITLRHRASRKAEISGDRPAWTMLGADPALQGVETVRLRGYLTGK